MRQERLETVVQDSLRRASTNYPPGGTLLKLKNNVQNELKDNYDTWSNGIIYKTIKTNNAITIDSILQERSFYEATCHSHRYTAYATSARLQPTSSRTLKISPTTTSQQLSEVIERSKINRWIYSRE